jgi:chaperone BCS1
MRLLSFNDEDEELTMAPLVGTYTLDSVVINIMENSKVHTMESRLVPEFRATLTAPHQEDIKKFLKSANNYNLTSKVTGMPTDTIKVFQNDYGWETDIIINKRSINSVQLPQKTKDNLLSDLKNFLSPETRQRYRDLEIPYNRVYMLYGPPGTGKTTLIQALASEFNKNIANIEFDTDVSDKLFKKILRRVPPDTIVCIEDIDCLFEDRKSLDCAKNSLTFSGILNALDGITKLDEKVIVITTNHLGRLDEALKRRVDYFVKFDFSTKSQVKDIYNRFYGEEGFESFWDDVKDLKMTPNILQKLFVRHLDGNLKDAREFINGEHSLDNIKEMYT